jgi:hypothetical protein
MPVPLDPTAIWIGELAASAVYVGDVKVWPPDPDPDPDPDPEPDPEPDPDPEPFAGVFAVGYASAPYATRPY